MVAPPLNYNVPRYTPMNFDFTKGRGWFGNLLRATGQFFLTGVSNTVNAQNTVNPYSYQSPAGMNPLILILVAFLIFKK